MLPNTNYQNPPRFTAREWDSGWVSDAEAADVLALSALAATAGRLAPVDALAFALDIARQNGAPGVEMALDALTPAERASAKAEEEEHTFGPLWPVNVARRAEVA